MYYLCAALYNKSTAGLIQHVIRNPSSCYCWCGWPNPISNKAIWLKRGGTRWHREVVIVYLGVVSDVSRIFSPGVPVMGTIQDNAPAAADKTIISVYRAPDNVRSVIWNRSRWRVGNEIKWNWSVREKGGNYVRNNYYFLWGGRMEDSGQTGFANWMKEPLLHINLISLRNVLTLSDVRENEAYCSWQI